MAGLEDGCCEVGCACGRVAAPLPAMDSLPPPTTAFWTALGIFDMGQALGVPPCVRHALAFRTCWSNGEPQLGFANNSNADVESIRVSMSFHQLDLSSILAVFLLHQVLSLDSLSFGTLLRRGPCELWQAKSCLRVPQV